MRPLALYLRSRQVPQALPLAAIAVAVVAQLDGAGDDPERTAICAVFALALGLSILGYGLGGAQDTLERTAAVPWGLLRAAHLVAIAVVVFAVASLLSNAPASLLIRDTAGMAGLTALAAAAFGHQLAWVLPIPWAGIAATMPPLAEPAFLRVLTWPIAPPSAGTTATVTATVLAVAGLIVYAVRGSRPSSAEDLPGTPTGTARRRDSR